MPDRVSLAVGRPRDDLRLGLSGPRDRLFAAPTPARRRGAVYQTTYAGACPSGRAGFSATVAAAASESPRDSPDLADAELAP